MPAEPTTRKPALVLAALSELAGTIADAKDPDTLFAAAEKAAQTAIGHRLFTVMAYDAGTVEVERLYSSNPEAYPAGGRKKKRDTAWGRQVLERGAPYIGRTASDIRESFDDHELILGLGLESVLNMPVRLRGATLGTVNLLHERNYYDSGHLGAGRILAGLLVGVLSH